MPLTNHASNALRIENMEGKITCVNHEFERFVES